MYDNMSRVIEISIDDILPNRFQPRIQFDEEEILDLSDSIKEHGVIQPIVVRSIGDKYEIIAGERRYKASVLAGKETVPVIIRNLNDKDSAEIALIENVQRKNLTPIEEALSYKKILDMGYITQENLAKKLGKSQSAVANKIRLLNLSDEVQEALLENKISERHARSLLKIKTQKEQNEMLNRIINERLTVRRTDEEIEKLENDETSGSQKIIEEGKGEINMNNNTFGISNIPETSQATQPFDIFSTGNLQQQSVNNPQALANVTESNNINIGVDPIQTPSFEFNNNLPPMQSSLDGFSNSFNAQQPIVNQNIASMDFQQTPVQSQPIVPQVPEMPIQPIVPQVPEMAAQPQQIGNIEFDINRNVMAAPIFDMPQQVTPAIPSVQPMNTTTNENIPTIDFQQTPVQQSDNLFGFQPIQEQSSDVQPATQPEFKMPEPIIVTDYSKQYDPVMPQPQQPPTPQVEFREVINAIRECSQKIEKYGFKIDVEEYDLANLYQVVFKVEK